MKLMTRTELLELLDTARKGVDTGDSLEGGLEWLQPYYDPEDTIPPAPPDTFYVRVALRVGNLNGQGGMILIGPGDEPESEGEAAARGAPEPLTEEERAAVLAIQLSSCPFCGAAAGMRKMLRDGCLPAEVEAFSYGATFLRGDRRLGKERHRRGAAVEPALGAARHLPAVVRGRRRDAAPLEGDAPPGGQRRRRRAGPAAARQRPPGQRPGTPSRGPGAARRPTAAVDAPTCNAATARRAIHLWQGNHAVAAIARGARGQCLTRS